MYTLLKLGLAALLAALPVVAQQPTISYTLRVDSADLSAFAVEMRVRNLPDTFRVAMAKHPEYDDRYWRYVEGLGISGGEGGASITRGDSAMWRVRAPGGEATIRYGIHLPPAPDGLRAAWRPFLAPTGGLVGGPHAFMYVVGAPQTPAHVRLELPASWDVATGLEPTSDPRVFYAPTADVLIDSPLLVGRFRAWRFTVDGVPHRIVYWPLPNAASFDTTVLTTTIAQITHQAVAVFGRAPWREYTFLLQDGAFGALEHLNSVTVGVPSADLARDPHGYDIEIAHEFFHAWNLMRIRPAGYGAVDYRPMTPSAGLWFSEGVTILYADLLARRAGLPRPDTTRADRVAGLIARYLARPGNARFSAEQVSRVAYNAEPTALGDDDASTHLQGELIGTMLDLVIRDATNGRRSMDDVMRAMLAHYSGDRGFTSRDVEQTVERVCRCDVTPLFDAVVRGAHAMDFNRYLALAGLRADVSWIPAEREGHAIPDLLVSAWAREGVREPLVRIFDPASVWARAGLHTGDRIVSVNGSPVPGTREFRVLVGALHIGDTVRVDVMRPKGPYRATVVVAGFTRPLVRISELPNITARQRLVRDRWAAGLP